MPVKYRETFSDAPKTPVQTAPPRDHGVALVVATVIVVIGIAACLMFSGTGCTADGRSQLADDLEGAGRQAQAASVAMAGSATTRPSSVVTTVETIAPATQPYFSLGGLGASLIGGALIAAAGLIRGSNKVAEVTTAAESLIADHKGALAALGADVATFKDPHTPFPDKLGKIISDAAGLTVAAPLPVPTTVPVASMTIRPAGPTPPATPAAPVVDVG